MALRDVQIEARGKMARDTTPGTGPSPMVYQRGALLARTADPGVLTLTLEQPLPAAEGDVVITPYVYDPPVNPAALWYRVTDTSDTVKTIETFSAAAPDDWPFSYTVFRNPSGG